MELTRRSFLKGSVVTAGTAILATTGLISASAEGEAAVEAAELAPGDIPVLVIDEFVTRPGEGKEFLEWFLAAYAETAEAAGLVLKDKLVFPPCWLPEASNKIQVVWEMQGGNAFWGIYNRATRSVPGTIEFWKTVNEKVEHHDRCFYGKAEDLEAMNNV